MALSLSNNFEGGTDGTTITTGNSGGTSGTAFDVVTIGTGVGITFDSTNPAHGAGLDMAIAQPATPVATYVVWSGTTLGTLTTNQTLYGRFYFVYTAIGTGAVSLVNMRSSSGALCYISISNTGNLRFLNSAAVLAGSNSTLALSANTLYRIEFQFVGIGGGTTAGSGQINIYSGDSTSALDTSASCSGVDFGSLAPTILRIGNISVGWASQTMYFDALNVNDTAFPGPEAGASQISRPSADIVTTGWSTAPLWSKINDQSDATVITSTI